MICTATRAARHAIAIASCVGIFLAVTFCPLASAALVLRYDFEDSLSLNEAIDVANPDGTATPNDNGLIRGAVYVPGKVGSFGLGFDGSNDDVNLGSNDLLRNVSGATLTAWVRLNALPSLGNYASIIFLSVGTSANFNSRAVLDIDWNGRVEAAGRASDSDPFRSRLTQATLQLDTWYHIAGVLDYLNDSIAIYVDGVSQGLLAGGGNWGGAATSNTNSTSVTVGSTAGGFEFINATLDEVRIYNTTLTAAEIQTIAVPEPATAALWGSGFLVLALRRVRRRFS